MKQIISFVFTFVISGAIGVQLIQPPSDARHASTQAPILVGANASAQVASVVERSCQNCHSLKTEWPFYSRIFPFSWMIEHDVQTARTRMNLSRWQEYDDGQKRALLAEIGAVVRGRIMPPRRYTMIHPEAKLSGAEIDEIYQWTRADRELTQRQLIQGQAVSATRAAESGINRLPRESSQ